MKFSVLILLGLLAAYPQGEHSYYHRHGQLNFACATCHAQNAGKRIRSEILSASLDHPPTGQPIG